jgi:hypothetical protein
LDKKMVYGFLMLFLVALVVAPALYAEEPDLISQEGEAGSAAKDAGSSRPVEVVDQPMDDDGSDPSAFEGDTDSMPGERAPENVPMDDSPAEGGIGIE